ncbi:unnamed protein product [Parascedosporium putredinis]|uniref:Uncharacterized protein n=1 Tax=Parascedosporium putredinis TaxID=1442378 RepID=A0A9P1GZY8_9PEZI|nr:unnamed protein product [Parascedosporium putredinis]CAI7992173.1 unnamed protein product [Parascedosporium putredinis]
MNRPSRTEDDLLHPTWNQNPPFLAPDLTTCEDLNGIANSRMLKKASAATAAAFGLLDRPGSLTDTDKESDGRLVVDLRPPRPVPRGRSSSTVPQAPTTKATLSLRALSRRDECENGGVSPEDYNVPLHVGALLIVMFVSSLACGFPMIARRFPVLRIPEGFFFAVRHFGTGVLIATAFIHLLPTAFISLGNPCLSAFWVQDYPAMPGAIALGGVFFVIIIEMLLTSPSRHHSHCGPPLPSSGPRGPATPLYPRQRLELLPRRDPTPPPHPAAAAAPGETLGARDRTSPAADKAVQVRSPDSASLEIASAAHMLSHEQRLKKEVLQCVLLEIGILFHSVFIGMALSVSVGKDFIVLLIAIAFHQAFEGLALGSRIADIDWADNPYRPWLMALAYGVTTPIGQAIGLATHHLYNPGSAFGLVLVGTMNAISSGLLIYASLVELLAVDFLSDESWEVLRGKKRVIACVIVFAGAFMMGLVGAWA